MNLATLLLTTALALAALRLHAAESVVLPAETTMQAARSMQVVVRGTIEAAPNSTVRVEFTYTPGSVRIRGAHGSASYALRDADIRVLENTLFDRTNARYVIECSNVQPLTDSILCVIDVDALKGPDSVGLITPTALIVNGVTSAATLQGGKVTITDRTIDSVSTQIFVENYPNPFRESTTFLYTLNETTDVQFAVFDLAGRQYASFDAIAQTPGSHSFTFAPPTWEVACGPLVLQLRTSSGVMYYPFHRLK
jgi:hypothetical protein